MASSLSPPSTTAGPSVPASSVNVPSQSTPLASATAPNSTNTTANLTTQANVTSPSTTPVTNATFTTAPVATPTQLALGSAFVANQSVTSPSSGNLSFTAPLSQNDTSNMTSGPSTVAIAVGSSLSALVFLALIFMGLLLWYRHRRTKKELRTEGFVATAPSPMHFTSTRTGRSRVANSNRPAIRVPNATQLETHRNTQRNSLQLIHDESWPIPPSTAASGDAPSVTLDMSAALNALSESSTPEASNHVVIELPDDASQPPMRLPLKPTPVAAPAHVAVRSPSSLPSSLPLSVNLAPSSPGIGGSFTASAINSSAAPSFLNESYPWPSPEPVPGGAVIGGGLGAMRGRSFLPGQ